MLFAFLEGKLVDEMIVTIAPVLLGSGIPLFRQNSFRTGLRLSNVTRLNQFVALRYEVIK